MASDAQHADAPSHKDDPPAQNPGRAALEAGPYVLRTLLKDVPLSADGANDDVKINCVDYLGAYVPYTAALSPARA